MTIQVRTRLVRENRYGPTRLNAEMDCGFNLSIRVEDTPPIKQPYWRETKDSPIDAYFLYLFETDEHRTDAHRVGYWPVYRLESNNNYTALTGSCWASISPAAAGGKIVNV